MPLLYLKAREAYELDAKISQSQVTRMREFRSTKPAPVVKKKIVICIGEKRLKIGWPAQSKLFRLFFCWDRKKSGII